MRRELASSAIMAVALVIGLAACADSGDDATGQASPSPAATAGAAPATASTSAPTAGPTPTPAATPTPRPTPSPPATAISRDEVRFTPSGSVFSPVGGDAPRNPHRTGGCPIQPHAEQNFTACEVTRGGGGMFAVTVERYVDDYAATIWQRAGDEWAQVSAVTYRRDDPDNPISIEPHATRWVNLDGLIHVGVEWGGSGGFWAHEVVHWPAGDADPSVAVVADARPAANMRAPAGVLLLTANDFAEDDATCCPSRREVVVLSRPQAGGGADATTTVVPRDAETPAEVALTVYTAWVDRDLASVSGQLSAAARSALAGTSPGEDVYALAGRTCPVRGGVHHCRFTTDSREMTFEVEQVSGSGRYRVTDVVR